MVLSYVFPTIVFYLSKESWSEMREDDMSDIVSVDQLKLVHRHGLELHTKEREHKNGNLERVHTLNFLSPYAS